MDCSPPAQFVMGAIVINYKGKLIKILIEIPKEFENHFKKDKFEDSLHRLNADAHCLAGNYEQETLTMLIKVFKNAKIFGQT